MRKDKLDLELGSTSLECMKNCKLLENGDTFGVLTFFAKVHSVDTCGSNGLPLTPNSITIYGKAQMLKTILHPNLCQYLDFIRSKHERVIIVSEYCGTPLIQCLKDIPSESQLCIAYQIVKALNEVHSRNLVHRNLSSENILVQSDMKKVKLFNYGMYSMTGFAKLVSFPLVQTIYAAPEVYLSKDSMERSAMSVDIWSLGIVLAELIFGQPLWLNLKLSLKIRKILSLIQCNGSVLERIAREHNCHEVYLNLNEDLKSLIEDCLTIMPNERPSSEELMERSLFDGFKLEEAKNNVSKKYEPFTIRELYHWWQLAGGDVVVEMKRQGFIKTNPPILSLPKLVLLDGTNLGIEKNPSTLYDERVALMPLNSLYERLRHIKYHHFYPIIHSKSAIIEQMDRPSYDASNLPLAIKEKDPEYQFHRIILLRRLLHGYPYTKHLIVAEAKSDIPPHLRGDVWAALLEICGDADRLLYEYQIIDKESPTSTDRQIEMDIPRCHQYNELLSSGEGHRKLKRILKAWVRKNTEYVYWQGFDSLTAPFLLLHFNNESKAFACLSKFVPKYLHKFFLKDNSAVIQEYLARFSQLIAFHDPCLSNHLNEIAFMPVLFAIPWFLTMFSHVFPLHKILHLWDKLLLGDSSYPLHIGLSILTQLRARLLSSGFNECILLFSDLPEVSIDNCVQLSMLTYEVTPKSITSRAYDNKSPDVGIDQNEVSKQNQERYPKISPEDVVALITGSPESLLIIDMRNPIQFSRRAILGSINIPHSSIKYGEVCLEKLGAPGSLILSGSNRTIVILGDDDTDADMFASFLLECNVHKKDQAEMYSNQCSRFEFIPLDKVCRICLLEKSSMKPLFGAFVPNMIMSISAVQILEGDGLPDKLCNQCMQMVSRFYSFKKQCEKSDVTLRQYVNDLSATSTNMYVDPLQSSFISDIFNEDVAQPYSQTFNTSGNVDSLVETMQSLQSIAEQCLPSTWEPEVPRFIHDSSTICDEFSLDEFFKCQFCNNTFKDDWSLSEHLKIHTHTSMFFCNICGKNFSSPSALAIHTNEHNLGPVMNPVAEVVQEVQDCALQNTANDTEYKKFECTICGKTYTQNRILIAHLRTHTGERPLSCNTCGKTFSLASSLHKHKAVHISYKKYKCDICDKRFRQKSNLNVHIKTHTGEKPHVCSICGKGFITTVNLDSHMRTHTGLKPFSCKQCDMSFTTGSQLRKHSLRHTGELPYPCWHCGKRFRHKDTRDTHIRYHTGNRPYTCSLCPKKYIAASHLRMHMKSHKNERTHQCHICEKTFLDAQTCKNHLAVHTGVKNFSCITCNQTFTQSASLRNHLKICNEKQLNIVF